MNNLDTRINKLLELDKARTQGEWSLTISQGYVAPEPVKFFPSINCKGNEIIVDEYSDVDSPNILEDYQFIAAMPEAVRIIRMLREENRRLKGGLDIRY